MNRQFIVRIAPIVIILAMICAVFAFNAYAISPASEDIIQQKLQEIGVEDGTVNGFYAWALDKIADSLSDMDSAMTEATGKEHNLADLFGKAITDTLSDFAGVSSEEEAFDKLGEIIGEIE